MFACAHAKQNILFLIKHLAWLANWAHKDVDTLMAGETF